MIQSRRALDVIIPSYHPRKNEFSRADFVGRKSVRERSNLIICMERYHLLLFTITRVQRARDESVDEAS